MTKRSALFVSTKTVFAALLFASLFAGAVNAGGFQLSVQTPSANDNETRDAVLLVRTYGCMRPEDADLKGTAEGLVNGERKTIPLTLKKTSKGVVAVTKQWGSEGTWVLTFSGQLEGMTCSVLVELGSHGDVKPGTRIEAGSRAGVNARSVQRRLTAEEINTALGSQAGGQRKAAEMGMIVWPAAGIAAVGSVLALIWRRHKSHV